MSFSLHSSTENFGGGRRSASVGSNSSSRLSCPVKSSIGLMSLKASARPLSRNHWNESRWMAIRSGSGRASSMLAKETRSGLRDREDNGQHLQGEEDGRVRKRLRVLRDSGLRGLRRGERWTGKRGSAGGSGLPGRATTPRNYGVADTGTHGNLTS